MDDVAVRTLITGGTGFIGANLAEYLSSNGREVKIIARSAREDMPPVRFAKIDVLDRDALSGIFESFRPHEVVHLAASSHFMDHDDAQGYRTNVEGTENVLHCVSHAESVRRCMFASSHVVNHEDLFDDKSSSQLRYADSKRALEQLIAQYPLAGKVCITIRPCSIWGPRFSEPFRAFFEAVAKGHYMHLGRHDPPKRLGYIGNLTFQIAKLLDAPAELVQRQTFHLADYETTTISSWAILIAKQIGRRPPWTMPEFAVRGAALAGDGLKRLGMRNPPLHSLRLRNMRRDSSSLPIKEIQAITGPLPYTLEQGVEETVFWLRSTGRIQ